MLGCFTWLQAFVLLQAAWQDFKRYLYCYQLSLDAPTGKGTQAWQTTGMIFILENMSHGTKPADKIQNSWWVSKGDEGVGPQKERVGLRRGHD